MKKYTRWILATSISIVLTSCTMTKPDGTPNEDPFEKTNRVIFAFNMDVDHLILRPTATVYSKVTPHALQKGVTNVFYNIGEITTFPNDILQGNVKYTIVDFWRFVINSTLGIGGLFDVATRFGIPKHVETFGMTLAKWRGGKSSPYIMLPIFGPSTLQNTIGLAPDYFASPWPYFKNQHIKYYALGANIIRKRAALLPANQLVDTAFDPYIFVRSAYMQNEQRLIDQNQHLDLSKESLERKENYLMGN